MIKINSICQHLKYEIWFGTLGSEISKIYFCFKNKSYFMNFCEVILSMIIGTWKGCLNCSYIRLVLI